MRTTSKTETKAEPAGATPEDDAPVNDPFAGRYDPAPVMGRHPDHPHEDGTYDPGFRPR